MPMTTVVIMHKSYCHKVAIPTASLVPGKRQGQQSPPFSIPSLATQLGQNLQLGLPFRTAVVSASEITSILLHNTGFMYKILLLHGTSKSWLHLIVQQNKIY